MVSPGVLNKSKNIWPILLLSFAAALIFFSRLHTYSEPVDRDIAIYSILAHEVLGGRDLYSEIWDHKPPGIEFSYGLAELIGGYGESGIFFLTLLTAYGTMIGCFALGRLIAGTWAGVFAALAWAIVSGGLAMQANKPNTEVIMNLCLVWGLYCFLRAQNADKTRNRLLLAAGAWFAYATTVKHVTVVLPIMLVAFLLFKKEQPLRRRIADCLRVALPGVLVWTSIIAYFAARGRFQSFYDCIVAYNEHYSGNILQNLISLFTVRQAAYPHYMYPLIGVFLLAFFGVVLTLCRDRRQGLVLLFWAVSCFVMPALPGRWFPHYYQFWLPMISVGAGIAVDALCVRRLPRLSPVLGALIAVCAFGLFLKTEIPYYRLTPDEWSNLKDNDVYSRSRHAADHLSEVVKPGERWWHWGSEAHLYFYSKTSPPIGIFYHYPLISGFKTEELSARAIRELSKNPPEVIISDDEPMPPLLDQWVKSHYAVERTKGFYGFSVLRRRDTGLTR